MPTLSASTEAEIAKLHELAALYQVQVSYESVEHQQCTASPESLLKILQVHGAPISRLADVSAALRERRLALARRTLEPVTVVWDDETPRVVLGVPAHQAGGRAEVSIRLESGEMRRWDCRLADCPTKANERLEAEGFVVKTLPFSGSLSSGYHDLQVELGGKQFQTRVIAAPRKAYDPQADNPSKSKTWGGFLPLYAIRNQRNWGSGDFTDLSQFAAWLHSQGGQVVATLPLLAALLDEPFEPSPYSPASRLFWNEFYLDIDKIPELANCPKARTLLGANDFALEALRAESLVNYRRLMTLKRQVLSELSESFFGKPSSRRSAFHSFVKARPEVEDYARFRAVTEKRRAPWFDWPERLEQVDLQAGDYDERDRQYHLYVQWLAEEQIGECARSLRDRGQCLYLDLPLGVNAASYDVWRERSAFAIGASGGCPPDAVFPNGQNWGFPPLHPAGIREQGYRYVVAYLRHQLKHAGMLRIDHIPALHRLYWVPDGASARDGVYVRYPSEELYAVFNLESHRHRALLVGEDLGTVPAEVPESMQEHHVFSMYVAQYAARPDPKQALPAAPAMAIASLNTHDMPPFAAYLKGSDIDERRELGLLGSLDPDKEHEKRQAVVEALARYLNSRGFTCDVGDPASLLRASLATLAASDARILLVNLEDLWLAESSQNMPGTSDEHPNWRRRARHEIDELLRMPAIVELLREVQLRRPPCGQK